MDAEDYEDIEDYWRALCERQELCGKCFASWAEHKENATTGEPVCPE